MPSLKSFAINDENFNIIIRFVTSADKDGLTNSIITFMRISDKKVGKVIRNDKSSCLVKDEADRSILTGQLLAFRAILIRLQVFFYWSEPFDDWIFARAGGGA